MDRRVCCWIGIHFFSMVSMQSTFQYCELQGWSLKIGIILSSVFNELLRCYLQQEALTINLWRATDSLGNTLGCWGIPWTPLANNSSDVNTVIVLETLFDDKQCLVWVPSPPLFGDFTYISFMYVYILGSFYCVGWKLAFQYGLLSMIVFCRSPISHRLPEPLSIDGWPS